MQTPERQCRSRSRSRERKQPGQGQQPPETQQLAEVKQPEEGEQSAEGEESAESEESSKGDDANTLWSVTFTDYVDDYKCRRGDWSESTIPRLVKTLEEAESLVCRKIAEKIEDHLMEDAMLSIDLAGGAKMLRDYDWLTETAEAKEWFKGEFCLRTFSWDISPVKTTSVDPNDGWEVEYWKKDDWIERIKQENKERLTEQTISAD